MSPRRSPRTPPVPAAGPLPTITLVESAPVAVVLAGLTRPGESGVQVLTPLAAEVPAVVLRDAKAKAGEVLVVPGLGGEQPERTLLIGLGEAQAADWRVAGAALARAGKGDRSLVLDLTGAWPDGPRVRALVEGLLLASYRFARKKAAEPRVLGEVVLVGSAELQADVDAAVTVSGATAAARDLVNTPPLEKSPAWLGAQAVPLLSGLDVTVHDAAALAKRGFGGILGVGQGSSRPPCLIEARYDGGGSRHVLLVGKGITFDSGGLSLKPNASMLDMKSDMGGAAAVLATLRAVSDLRLKIKVTVLAATAENMPSGSAQRPGDVLTQYGGRTVEVLNTDAEGRLVLADALSYGARMAPDAMVDLATLTGAMPVALGKRHAGLFSSDDVLADQLLQAAERAGEPLWRMPLVEDYRVALDSPVADLRNIGRPSLKLQGGSITAALFLREFTGGLPWAHLDIAGPAFTGSDTDERTKGGTGYGVRLLVAWLTALAAAPAGRRRAA